MDETSGSRSSSPIEVAGSNDATRDELARLRARVDRLEATRSTSRRPRRRLVAAAMSSVLFLGAVTVVQFVGHGRAEAEIQTFSTPGAVNFTVPAGVGTLVVDAYGASGGGYGSTLGGPGGHAHAALAVIPGETLSVHVGGRGGDAPQSGAGGEGGSNGGSFGFGGSGGRDFCDDPGGGGGGASSDVSRGDAPLIVAGGGGGIGQDSDGGAGGGTTGGDGGGSLGGGGGTQDAVGGGPAGGGNATAGTPFGGGRGDSDCGGGGGGGYRGGGGGGPEGGGGGGSGFGPPGTSYDSGINRGDGKVVLAWNLGTGFHTLDPSRVVDTRDGSNTALNTHAGQHLGPIRGGNDVATFAVAGPVGNPATTLIPLGASAAVFNFTVTNIGANGYATVFPADLGSAPLASDINFAGPPYGPPAIANRVIVRLPTTGPNGGQIKIRNGSNAKLDVIVDLVGYFM